MRILVVLFVLLISSYAGAEPGDNGMDDRILPDPVLTPGVINPAITQDNIHTTICVPKHIWKTKYIRPPVKYTQALKHKQLDEYGYTDKDMRHYEEDHLISLQLGGSPYDPKNLWPESRISPPNMNALHKDKVENFLRSMVCGEGITLKEAQDQIAKDWTVAYKWMIDAGYVDPYDP